jgi:CRISPR-associated protein Cas2
MLYLISYDIPADKRRLKVARALEGAGQRVQRSVFECDLSDAQWAQLRRRLMKLIDLQSDSLRVYRICGSCLKQIESSGVGPPIESSEDVIIV